jgi:hypothetical protein
VLLTVGSATIAAMRKGSTEPVPARPLRYIDPAGYPVLVAAAKRILPPGDPHAETLVYDIDDTLHFAQANVKDVNAILGLLENGLAGILTRGSSTPFTLLSPEQQDAALLRWRDSRISLLNGAYNGLKKMILGAYYGNGERAKLVGYQGPVYDKPDPGPIEPRGRLSPPYVPAVKENP